MKKLICIAAAVLLLTGGAAAEELTVEKIDFENSRRLTTLCEGGTSVGLERVREDFGYSCVMECTADTGVLMQLDRKTSVFNDGQLTLELDFMYTNRAAIYYLVHLRSVSADGTLNHNRDCFIKNGVCGTKKLSEGRWYHLKYVVDVDAKKSVFYIDGERVGSNDKVIIDGDFSAWRISLQNAAARLYVDNMTVTKDTARTKILSVTYTDADGKIFSAGDISDGLYKAEVLFDRNLERVSDDSVSLLKNGRPCGGYYVRNSDENLNAVEVYFTGEFQKGAEYELDFSALRDEWGLNVMSDSKIEFEINSPSFRNAEYRLCGEDSGQITDYGKISDGDKVRLCVSFENDYVDEWKPCTLALGVYDESGRLIGAATEEVTVSPYIRQLSLTTDFLTIDNPGGGQLRFKGFLWESRSFAPEIEEFDTASEQELTGTLAPDFSAFEEYIHDEITSPSMYFDGYASACEKFCDTVCFVADSGYFYSRGKKYRLADKPVYADGKICVKKSVLQRLFDRSLEGGGYIALESAAEQMSLYYSQSHKGLGVISDKYIGADKGSQLAEVEKIIRYIVFERPSREHLKAAIAGMQNPRAAASREKLAEIKASDDVRVRQMTQSILRDAKDALSQTTPAATPNGSAPVGADYSAILKLYWAYEMTGERRYADKAIEHAMTMAAWDNWMDTHYFLGTSYYMLTCGYVYDLFQDELTAEQKQTLRSAIYEKGLLPAREHYYGRGKSNWPLRNTNWNVVCNAGTIVAALAICNDCDDDVCFDILEKALVSLEYAMLEFAPEGGWYEGVGYAGYTVNYHTLALQALMTSFGMDYSLANAPGFLKYGYFPFYMTATEDKLNLHDEIRGRNSLASTAAQWIAEYTGDAMLQSMRMRQIRKANSNKPTFFDLLWNMPGKGTEYIDAPLDKSYAYAEMSTSRSGWEDDATFLGVHAGDNSVSHGQPDIGQFELESYGVRFALDMGRDDYSLPNYFYFGSTREEYYVNRAEGHNVYVINPDKSPGQYYYAASTVKTVQSKPDGVIYTVDMTPAYIGQVKKAQRGYMLTDNRRVFVMQDEIVPRRAGDEYYWFWHTDAKITLDSADKSHVMLEKNGKTLDLYFDANVEYTVSKGESVPLPTSPKGEGEQLKTYGTVEKITVRFTSGTEKIKLRVTAVPGGAEYNRSLSDISSWRIADGIRSDRYTVSDGAVSGVPEGVDAADFLSHIYAGDAEKRLLSGGTEYTSGKITPGLTLEISEADNTRRYEIVTVKPAFSLFYGADFDGAAGAVYATTTARQTLAGFNGGVYFGTAAGKNVRAVLEEDALHIIAEKPEKDTILQMFANLASKDLIDGEWIRLEFDYKVDETGAQFDMEGRIANVPRSLLSFGADGAIAVFGKNAAEYEIGRSYHIALCICPGASALYRLYIDDELAAAGSCAYLAYEAPMSQLKFVARFAADKDASVWLDNVRAERIFD